MHLNIARFEMLVMAWRGSRFGSRFESRFEITEIPHTRRGLGELIRVRSKSSSESEVTAMRGRVSWRDSDRSKRAVIKPCCDTTFDWLYTYHGRASRDALRVRTCSLDTAT